MKYIKDFLTHADYEAYINGPTSKRPNVSHCENMMDIHYNPYDYSRLYLTTKVIDNSYGDNMTVSFIILAEMGTDMIESISYSTDNGETWITTENTDNKEENLVISVNVNVGSTILWKGIANQIGFYDTTARYTKGSNFASSYGCMVDVEGNVMSLCYGDDFYGENTLNYSGQFANLFNNSNFGTLQVVNAKNLWLPTNLSDYCYNSMFYGTPLITPPVLSATTLSNYCYYSMFQYCSSLVNAPKLPATTLAQGCYSSMFGNCSSLVKTPDLPQPHWLNLVMIVCLLTAHR